MIKGLTLKEFNTIKQILQNYQGEFYAYGSRVKGDFTKLSDLDIAVKAPKYDEIIPILKEKFDQSTLPFIVNFINLDETDQNFIELIKKDLVRLD